MIFDKESENIQWRKKSILQHASGPGLTGCQHVEIVWYVFTNMWIPDQSKAKDNQTITTAPEKLGDKENPKRDTWIAPGKGIM